MAVIRNTASMMLRGKVGNTSYYTSEGRQLARQAQNNSNYGENASRTPLQQGRRVMWPNLVNFYTANKAWMKKSFENLKAGVSEFNRFIQLNINSADIALTRQQAQSKIWVPSRYRVSQGSLPSITRVEEIDGSEVECMNLNLGDFEPTTGKTRGELYQALIDNNANIKAGDAIVAIRFSGCLGGPFEIASYRPASYIYEEYVIDPNDTTPIKDAEFFATDEFFGITEFMSNLVVFIHTRNSGGKLYLSTEDMVTSLSMSNLEGWHTASQKASATASYGETTEVMLAPRGSTSSSTGDGSTTGGNTPSQPGSGGNLGE